MLNIFKEFFMLEFWDIVSNIFTAVGILSVFFTIFRYFYNNRTKDWIGNVTIKDYDRNYDIENLAPSVIYSEIWDESSEYAVTIVFTSVDCIIKKLQIIELNGNGRRKSVIQTIKNITPETPVCLKTERLECIPKYKLRWYIDFGEYSEYDINENCRNGINDITGAVYKKSFISKLRKALGLR